MVIILSLPAYSPACRGSPTSTGSFFNYTPLVVGVVLLGDGLAWVLGMNKRYKGPIRQIEFDEGMGVVEEKPADGEPPPAAPAS